MKDRGGSVQISERLKRSRTARGITQAQAAEELDVPLRTYQDWEGGQHVSALERAIRVLRFVDTDPDTKETEAHG
jgi:transcriptional regulator with XRE-family HTH domain